MAEKQYKTPLAVRQWHAAENLRRRSAKNMVAVEVSRVHRDELKLYAVTHRITFHEAFGRAVNEFIQRHGDG